MPAALARGVFGLLAVALVVFSVACESDADTTTGATTARTETPTATTTATADTGPSEPSVPDGLTPALVTHVVDGDTIDVEIAGAAYTVRYIGIDTPETVHPSKPVQCFGREASARNKKLVEGKTVGLESDVSETDDFGRLLRYVWLGEEMVNATLVREGYAYAATYPPDVKHQALFTDLQREAREQGAGLWGASCDEQTSAPTPTGQSAGAATCPDGAEYSIDGHPTIKGNINGEGERIYHLPTDSSWAATRINESAGERWFCTVAEAQAAGWRAVR